MEKHSKRNKSKDNPYTLSYNETTSSYVVEFKDNKNIIQKVEISDEVYQAFDKFELEDISQIHKYRKHIEHNEVYEENLYHRAINNSVSIEEEIEEKIIVEELKDIINSLPEIQKKRLKKYYFEDMTLEQIAKEENCTKRAVKFTIDIAIEKISKKIKN